MNTPALNALRHRFRVPHTSPFTRHTFQFGNFRKFSSSRPTSSEYVRFDGSSRQPRWGLSLNEWGLWAAAYGVVFYITHLEKVPETDRWRFMVSSRKLEDTLIASARDAILEKHADQILPPDHILSRQVRRVTTQILSASNLGHVRGSASESSLDKGQPWGVDQELGDPDAQKQNSSETQREWEVVVVNDPKVINAHVIPGLIVIFTGILPICRDDNGLSAILAHEIGHVVARHASESLSSQIIQLLFLSPFIYLFGSSKVFLAQHFFFELPNSRIHEYEADRIGLTLMSRACYDPKGAVEMFTRLDRLESGRLVDFFHTHPSTGKRVEELSKILPEAYAVLQGNPDCAAIQEQFMDAFKRFNVKSGSQGFDEISD